MRNPKKIIFDVGANDCHTFIQEIKDNPYTHLYAFEPTPRLIDYARENFHHLKNFHLFPHAIGDEEGYRNFNVAGQADWGCSSFLEFSEKSKTDWDGREDFVVTEVHKIWVRRLENIIQENDIKTIDYLHVDTQGFDLKVLNGLGKYLSIVKEGVVEAAAKSEILYYNQNTLDETVRFLENNGFQITSITENDHLGNEVNIHFRRENKVKLFVVTYNNPKILNQCLESVFLNSSPLEQSNLQVFVINNHSNFYLENRFTDKVTVIHNHTRPDFSTGHLSRNWNQCILHGFVDLNNPHCDILITCQDDTIFSNHYIGKLIELHQRYDLVTCGPGDNMVSYTPQAIRRIGLWDERFCGIGYQEMDYFIRAFKYHKEKSSINDYYHNQVHNPIEPHLIPIEFILTGWERQDDNHLVAYNFHMTGAQVFVLKWPDLGKYPFEVVDNIEPQIDSYVLYPYFEKDVETLVEQKYLFKVEENYLRIGEGLHRNKFDN